MKNKVDSLITMLKISNPLIQITSGIVGKEYVYLFKGERLSYVISIDIESEFYEIIKRSARGRIYYENKNIDNVINDIMEW